MHDINPSNQIFTILEFILSQINIRRSICKSTNIEQKGGVLKKKVMCFDTIEK